MGAIDSGGFTVDTMYFYQFRSALLAQLNYVLLLWLLFCSALFYSALTYSILLCSTLLCYGQMVFCLHRRRVMFVVIVPCYIYRPTGNTNSFPLSSYNARMMMTVSRSPLIKSSSVLTSVFPLELNSLRKISRIFFLTISLQRETVFYIGKSNPPTRVFGSAILTGRSKFHTSRCFLALC